MDTVDKLTQGKVYCDSLVRNSIGAALQPLTFRKVRSPEHMGGDDIRLTLFRDAAQRVCGWFIGPVRITAGEIDIAYLPRSERLRASVAIVRAIEAAESAGLKLCIVDPDDLWAPAWSPEPRLGAEAGSP